MDILGLIKDKLTDSVIEKVSNFLGEHPEKIDSALNSAVPIVLGGIIRNASNEEDAGKVLDILKDGGHTGEILDDLPSLLSNFDKTQLLITIGSNIFNHFAGSKGNGIVEKLSSLNGVRKTSASSLVGLAAPLVLGALGKIVTKEGLGISGLIRLLADQNESVFGALPPAIANQLNFRSSTSSKNSVKDEKPREEKKNHSSEKTSSFGWIPWVLVGIIFMGGVVFFWKYRKQNVQVAEQTENPVTALPKQDSTTATADTTFAEFPSDTTTSFETKAPPVSEVKPIETTKKIEEPKKEVKTVERKAEEPKVKEEPKSTFENIAEGKSVSEQLKNRNSWIAINTNFKKNSAEVSSKGQLQEVAKFLKNNKKADAIIAGGSQSSGRTLAEDRAYAVRDILIEMGVNENQLSVQSSAVKDVDAKVVVKIK
jgi:outer membrane protein OmpA-like peptidoglycan-associated protein